MPIQRKKHISNAVYGVDWYKCDGQYSKGKIHCGCGLCKFGKRYGLPAIRDKKFVIIQILYIFRKCKTT